jgi:hypothetical protein
MCFCLCFCFNCCFINTVVVVILFISDFRWKNYDTFYSAIYTILTRNCEKSSGVNSRVVYLVELFVCLLLIVAWLTGLDSSIDTIFRRSLNGLDSTYARPHSRFLLFLYRERLPSKGITMIPGFRDSSTPLRMMDFSLNCPQKPTRFVYIKNTFRRGWINIEQLCKFVFSVSPIN